MEVAKDLSAQASQGLCAIHIKGKRKERKRRKEKKHRNLEASHMKTYQSVPTQGYRLTPRPTNLRTLGFLFIQSVPALIEAQIEK
jgi:hypothetical protein